MAKIHLPYIVFLTRSQGHPIPPEGPTYLVLPPPKVHDAAFLHFAYLIGFAIVNQGQRLGKNPSTHLVVVSWHVETQGLVRAGCACYTTAEEVERLVEGVRDVARFSIEKRSSPPVPSLYRPETWVTPVRRHGLQLSGDIDFA